MRIMALDVGDKRIGVAVTDPSGMFAQPLTTLERKGMGADVARIFQLARDNEVKCLVFGVPYDDEGKIGAQAAKVLELKEKVAHLLKRKNKKITVETCDESMTTHDAHEELKAMDIRHAKRKGIIDEMAAVMILESWMEGNK